MLRKAIAVLVAFVLLVAAPLLVPDTALAKKHHGPCHDGDVASVVNRPGVGSATESGGSPCTVQKGRVVLEIGYRNEVNDGNGGRSRLSSYPMALFRTGLDKRNELIVILPTLSLQAGTVFPPAIGAQDAGVGLKHAIANHRWFQDAVQFVMSEPSGTNGYSAGGATFALTYGRTFPVGSRVDLDADVSVVDAPGMAPSGAVTRYFISYQPSIALTYSLDRLTSLTLNDNLSVPTTPTGGSSNVLSVALQRSLSPGTVVDVESEFNLTPAAGYRQRAIGFGAAFFL